MKKIFALLFFVTSVCKAQYGNGGQYATTQSGLLNNASVFTVEFWVKTTESRGNNVYWQRPFLFGNETDGDNSGDFGITLNNGYIGMFEGVSNLNSDQQFLSNQVKINDLLWHHIAAVNNGQTINLYVDGNIVGSLVSGRRLNTFNAPLTFGAASLDHSFAGNVQGNKNFISQASFGQARISNSVRYGANFSPPSSFIQDASTLALFQFDNQNFNSQPSDPNQPVVFAAGEGINDNAAQPATLYINDSKSVYGRLLLGKKDWSLSNDILVRFFEGDSKKVTYYKPEDIKGFQMGDSYYEPKLLGSGGSVNTPFKKTIVKRLTPAGSKMNIYEYDSHTIIKNSNGLTEYKDGVVYFIQLPNTHDDKIYQFTDNKFVPKFDTKVSAYFADKPDLANKIRSKDKDYFYPQVTEMQHPLKVWSNIVNEYNKP